jgi:hypothetical protein
MQQGQRQPMQQGFRGGGLASLPRSHYGIGSWLKKKGRQLKNIATKLTPKELAPAMTWAAPFMGPIAGPIMGGLGSLKMHGKLDPKIMAMAMLPHARFGMPTSMGGSGMGYGKWGGGSSIRNLLTGMGRGKNVAGEGILNKFGDFGTNLDAQLFGSKGKWLEGQGPAGMERDWIAGKKGLLDLGGGTVGEGDLLKTLTKQMTKPGDLLGSMEKIGSVIAASASYAEALELANKAGVGEHMPGTEAEYNAWRDRINEGTKDFWKGTEAEAYRTGGRVGYAMGSTQFPPQRRMGYQGGGRSGLQWGSDKGEGLGGEEVEADMRYEGGFMPYGEEPKADDVPARLSKDEFVFTDQAVASAGEGDVELGAERLYNVMKNLEQGGRLSEESQGEMSMVGQGLGQGLGLEGEMGEGIGAII